MSDRSIDESGRTSLRLEAAQALVKRQAMEIVERDADIILLERQLAQARATVEQFQQFRQKWSTGQFLERGIDYEAMAKQYADWHGVDWTDDDEMEACRRRVRELAALGIGGDVG